VEFHFGDWSSQRREEGNIHATNLMDVNLIKLDEDEGAHCYVNIGCDINDSSVRAGGYK
jgi:hypothetical protein